MAGAAPVGAVIGSATAPPDERKEAHAAYGGALAVAIAAVAGNYLFNDDAELKALREKKDVQRDPVMEFISEGAGKIGGVGKDGASNASKWRRFKVDKWVKESPTKMHHQDEVIEILNDKKGN